MFIQLLNIFRIKKLDFQFFFNIENNSLQMIKLFVRYKILLRIIKKPDWILIFLIANPKIWSRLIHYIYAVRQEKHADYDVWGVRHSIKINETQLLKFNYVYTLLIAILKIWFNLANINCWICISWWSQMHLILKVHLIVG